MLLEEYALARCAPVRMWTIRYGITIPKDGVFTQRGGVPHLMKKILYINTGGVFNLNYLSGKTPGGKVRGWFFQLLHQVQCSMGVTFLLPTTSCGKVMFLHLSVILFTGGSLSRGSLSRSGVSVQGNPPFLILVLLDFLFSRVKASNANIGIISNFV